MKHVLLLLSFLLTPLALSAQDHKYNAGYIYLDGTKLSMAKIDTLRNEIIKQYNEGTEFKNLITQYNMDHNPQADKFEFTEDMVVPEFVQAVKGHKPGEIFTVDVPYENWYYVVVRNPDAN